MAIVQSSANTRSISIGWETNPAFSGYELIVDGGPPLDVGNVGSYVLEDLTPNTSYDISVRGYVDSFVAGSRMPVDNWSASSWYYTEPPANAFNDSATYWTTDGPTTGWLQAGLSGLTYTTPIVMYGIRSRGDQYANRNPKNWTLEASINPVLGWVTLDTQTNVVWGPSETKTFPITNDVGYTYYRLNITANSGASSYLSLDEFFLYSSKTSVRTVDTESTQSATVSTDALANPSNVQVISVSWDSARISWDVPEQGDDPVRYEYRINLGDPIDNGLVQYVSFESLSSETTYLFDVRTVTEDDVSSWVSADFTTLPPYLVEDFEVSSIRPDSVRLTWFPPPVLVDILRYEYRVNNGEVIDANLSRRVTVSELNPETVYRFDVRVVTAEGSNPWVSVSATTKPVPAERLTWTVPDPSYILGVDRGVLYPRGKFGVAWNGLINVSERTLGGELEPVYVDGVKHRSIASSRDFQAIISAYSAPQEFAPCEGVLSIAPGFLATRQNRERFGFSYRSMVGGNGAYRIHVVYNATASPGDKSYATLSNSPSPSAFSWTVDSVPVVIGGFAPTSHFVIESSAIEPERLEAIESLLYGTETRPAYLPTIPQLAALVTEWNPLIIIPDSDSGLSPLIPGMGDLINSDLDGLYLSLPKSRLVQSSVTGLYTLRE